MVVSRRGFLAFGALVPVTFRLKTGAFRLKAEATGIEGIPASFPAQDPELVEDCQVSHGNSRAREGAGHGAPALAPWTGAMATGRRRSTLRRTSATADRRVPSSPTAPGRRSFYGRRLGQLPLVRAWIDAAPGIQRTRGPHGITLLAHARAGGPAAADVLTYLESLGDADPRYADVPLTDAEQAAIAGEYAFGAGATERLTIARGPRAFTIQRPGYSERNLFHQGGLVFNPPGAEAVRIRFERSGGPATAVVIEDGPGITRATRVM